MQKNFCIIWAKENARIEGGAKAGLCVSFWVVCLAEKVINAHLIMVGQLHEQFIGELLGAGFQIAVFSLGDADAVSDLLLGQVVILPQIPDPVPHGAHPLAF